LPLPCCSAPLRLCVSISVIAVLCGPTLGYAADDNSIKTLVLIEAMASRGAGYDASELHARGVEGLAAVLNHLLPDTAPPAAPLPPGPPEEEVRRLIARLDADDFRAREQATETLIATARGRREMIEQAAVSDSLEVRLRSERVLASWDTRPMARLDAYLSGLWVYLEGITDPPRLKLLAERTMKAFEQGMPEGDRLHLLRLCIAGVAHGRDDASCDLLRPLIRQADVRIATLVTETAGAYRMDAAFLPLLMIDALKNDKKPVVEAALRFVAGCQDQKRREALHGALREVFQKRDESLKFQASLPLLRDFDDADAIAYVTQQTTAGDADRARTALNWISDTKRSKSHKAETQAHKPEAQARDNTDSR
jgi:hypothetical protein